MSAWPNFSTRKEMNSDDVAWMANNKIVYDRTSWTKEQNWCFALERKHIGQIGKLYVTYGDVKDSRIVPKFVDRMTPMFDVNGLYIEEVRAPRLVNLSHEVAKRELVFKKIADETANDDKAALILYIGERTKATHEQLCILQSLLHVRIIHLSPQIVAFSLENSEIRDSTIKHIKKRVEDAVRYTIPRQFPAPEWLSNGTMIFGYHKATPDTTASTRELWRNEFLGDFHFDTVEVSNLQITPEILISRFKWMLGLHKKNRGQLPERIFVLRGYCDSEFECPKSAKIDPDNGTWPNCLPENNSATELELLILKSVCAGYQTGYHPTIHLDYIVKAGCLLTAPLPILESIKWIKIGAGIFSAFSDNGFILPRTNRLLSSDLAPPLTLAVDWEKVTKMMAYHGNELQ